MLFFKVLLAHRAKEAGNISIRARKTETVTTKSTDGSDIDDKSIAWGQSPLAEMFAGSLGRQSQRMTTSTLLSQIDFDMKEQERLHPFVPRPNTSYEGIIAFFHSKDIS